MHIHSVFRFFIACCSFTSCMVGIVLVIYKKLNDLFLMNIFSETTVLFNVGAFNPSRPQENRKWRKVPVTLFRGGTSKLYVLGTSDPRLHVVSYHDSLVVKGGTLGHLPSHDPISLVCFPSHVYNLSVLRLARLGSSLATWYSTGHGLQTPFL